MSNPWRLFILDCDSSIKPEAKEWGISKQIIWTLFIVVNIDLILGINMIIAILGKKWWKQKLRIEYSNVTLLRISDKCRAGSDSIMKICSNLLSWYYRNRMNWIKCQLQLFTLGILLKFLHPWCFYCLIHVPVIFV